MIGNTSEHRRELSVHLRTLAACLGVPTTSLGAPVTCLGALQITVEQSGKNIICGNTAGAPRNHSYYLLFNNFSNSCIQFVFSSKYLYSDPSTQGISGLGAGGV